MYEEEYSTRGTTAQIKVDQGSVIWTCYYAGAKLGGSVALDEDGQEAGLARARRAVDAAVAAAADNPPVQETVEEQPVILTPGTGDDTEVVGGSTDTTVDKQKGKK